MKKSTILVICILFLASVLVVGFFGMNAESYYSKVYVQSITPASIDCSTDEKLFFGESDEPNRYTIVIHEFVKDMVIRVDFDVYPNDATFFNDIQLEITSQGNYTGSADHTVATLEGKTIKLHQPGFADVTYRAMDGSNVYMTIAIYVLPVN